MSMMLLGVLRMPLPDRAADIDPMMWMQIKDRMREAADEIDRLQEEMNALKSATRKLDVQSPVEFYVGGIRFKPGTYRITRLVPQADDPEF